MQIRAARPEEYPVVGALTVRAYVGGGFVRPESPYVPVLADVASRAHEADVLVAVNGDAGLLGAVTFAPPGSSYAELAGSGEAGFRMLVVDPAARGRGVGAALVRACIDRAHAAGCTTVRISTQPDMTDAHRLYRRLGFYRTPDRDWEPMPGISLLAYALDLPRRSRAAMGTAKATGE
jgi:ribosomal protein S18 acetylase RimI-like enzyme